MRLSILQVARDFGWRSAVCYAAVYVALLGWIAFAILSAIPRVYGPAAPFDGQYALWLLGSAVAVFFAIMLLLVAAVRLARRRQMTAPEMWDAATRSGPEGDRVRRALALARRQRAGGG